MDFEIKVYPDPVLRKKAEDVEKIDDEIIKILDTMRDMMYSYKGIGLAAEQIGLTKKLIVIDMMPEGTSELIQLINPKIVKAEDIYEEHEEGCLSVPGYYDVVKNRKKGIRVEYIDRNGNEQVIETEDFLSVVLQHEIDHLNGTLFVDRLSPIKRGLFKKEWKKIQKERQEKE